MSKKCPLTVWRCVYEGKPCMECRMHRVRAWMAKRLFGKQYKCPKYQGSLIPPQLEMVYYINVNPAKDGKPIYKEITQPLPEIELTPEAEQEQDARAEALRDVLEKLTAAWQGVADDLVRVIGNALRESGEGLESLMQELMALDTSKSRKDRARREKGRRLAKERRARRSRPVPAPPGGYIWIRHKKRTRHLARGEGQ